IAVDASAADRTITLLPAAVAGNGFKLVVKKVDSSENIVTVDADGSETIDGDLSRVLRMQNQSIALICDGAGWRVLGGDAPSTDADAAATRLFIKADPYAVAFV